MRPNPTADTRAALCARVGWVRDVLHELLGERYPQFRRHQVAARGFADLPRDCQDAVLRAEALKARRRRGLVPFAEAARNLIRTVVEAGAGHRQGEPPASLARRIRSWQQFKRTARQWCRRQGGR